MKVRKSIIPAAGLGHAIYCTKSFISNDIVYSDRPCLKQMIEPMMNIRHLY